MEREKFKCPFEEKIKNGEMVCDSAYGDTQECPTEVFNRCQNEPNKLYDIRVYMVGQDYPIELTGGWRAIDKIKRLMREDTREKLLEGNGAVLRGKFISAIIYSLSKESEEETEAVNYEKDNNS